MDFQWVALAFGDIIWIFIAFIFGILAKQINLPPLVGFLATGFLLNYFSITSGETLQKLADIGITLLLFTVGLKLKIKFLLKPEVWSVTVIHLLVIIISLGSLIFTLSLLNTPLFSELDYKTSILIAFALSFSSTVFVVKSLEDKGEMNSLYGRIAIGILVMQDLVAVIFLATSTGQLPSLWAVLLLLLIPLRPLFHSLLQKTGHGELLILYGLVLALGGAELFEFAGIKDDLGAIFMGVLISSHPKANEIAKSMLGFKDLFLVGFFLSIGMAGQFSYEALIIGILLVPFVLVKSSLFFILMTKLKLRSRTALLATLNLSNYSEFGLIIIAIGVSNNWINPEWLMVFAIAVSFSFVLAAPLTSNDDKIYTRYRKFWMSFQKQTKDDDHVSLQLKGCTLAIFGMGRIGSGAYDKLCNQYEDKLIGIDFDADQVKHHLSRNRHVIYGDPSDIDLWLQIKQTDGLKTIMLALPNLQANLEALKQLKEVSFSGQISSIARFSDEEKILCKAGASAVFNVLTEAGAGFATHTEQINNTTQKQS